MPHFVTIAQLARKYGLSIAEIVECARMAGVSARTGAAKLYPAQETMIAQQIAITRRDEEFQRRRRRAAPTVRFATRDYPEHVPEAPVRVECHCCQIALGDKRPGGPSYCPACEEHYAQLGEPMERTLARLREHDVRMRRSFVAARNMVDKFREQLKGVHSRLDDWREAAVRMAIDHQDNTDDKGHCKRCGGKTCHAIRILQDVNPGFLRRVETLACFDDEELQRHLHPRRQRDSEYLANDDDTETG